MTSSSYLRTWLFIEQSQQIAAHWLAGMGLELHPEKTRITHTLHASRGRVGFDFLGQHVRQFRVGKTRTSNRPDGTPTGVKTIIRPSPEAQRRHLADLGQTVRRHRQRTQTVLIEHLNRQIGGWANSHRAVASSKVFSRMDHLVWLKLRRWALRRHPQRGRHWVVAR